MALQTYRELDVWKVSMDLVDAVYDITEKLPSHQRFSISSQIERAALSVPLNIAEGCGRLHIGDYLHHLSYSQGSIREVETLPIVISRRKYLDQEEIKPLWELTQRIRNDVNKAHTIAEKMTLSNLETRNPIPDTSGLDRELLRERFAMRSLLEFARTLTPDLGPDGILKSVLRTIMGKGLITEGFSYLSLKKDGGEQRYQLVSRSGFRGLDLPQRINFEMLETWLFTPPERTHFTLPILDSEQQEIIGFLGFGKSLSPETDISTEQNYLESLSLLTGIALTNAALFESERERERFEAQLQLAREIQQSLLPQSLPEVKGLSFTAYSKQSELVGGDYYDVIKLSDTKALVAIADVVGKGISAAILMSSLQASLRALVSPLRSNQITLLEMVRDLNRLIYESTAAERYITAVLAVIDSMNDSMTAIICGHPRPIVHTASGEFSELPTSGVPLGVIQNYEFKVSEMKFSEGSSLILYTDGLSEAVSEGHMLGAKGVENFFSSFLSESSIHTIESILASRTNLTVQDDITVVAVSRS